MKVALGFALDKPKPEHTPVLFVFLIMNYSFVNGLMMNNEAFTAYPAEGELLLQEGFQVFVYGIEKGHKIENKYESMQKYNGQTITIVYLYG